MKKAMIFCLLGTVSAILAGGPQSGVQGSESTSNTFYGKYAGASITTGIDNSFFGYQAGYATAFNTENTFIGAYAGRNNTGLRNAFLGAGAGYANISGSMNTFLGASAGRGNIGGHFNTVVGYYAAYTHATGDYNVIVGNHAGRSNTGGTQNTFIGSFAGNNNASGNGNVFLGYNAGYYEMGSKKLYIADSNTSSPLIYGDFASAYLKLNGKVGIKKTPTHLLDVGVSGAYCNGGAWVDGSSRDYKENIEPLTSSEARQAFALLQPVKFNYKESEAEQYLGFIAEDVPELVAMQDRKGLNAMDIAALLTKVVQEQQKILAAQQKEISELRESIANLEKRSSREK